MHFIARFTILSLAFLYSFVSTAQPNTNVENLEKDKPKEYKSRTLRSEKTGSKKFTLPVRISQNTYTHFNYYFNANEKIKEVIARAKALNKEDYTVLLPFYNYTLDGTSKSKDDIDSIIYKCTAGILLHDLRNDWVDNLYLLMGKAYLLKKDYDSAAGCFQYINYTYAPKEKGGYDKLLGSNSNNTNGVFTISTNEKRNILQKITSRPPSRNESFVWQVRSLLEQDMLGEAAGLIGILRSDPLFPKRLKTDLHEMVAYWFYKQQNYDSAAAHLKLSLDNAEDKLEKARWEFLAGQLYQLAHNDSLAIKMYDKSIAHTTDPLMEIYARLNIVSLASGKKKNALQENLNELLKLARRDKYESYRDIIYYAAAQLELKRDGFANAQNHLLKSVKYSIDNPQQKSLSFIMLADLNYAQKKFIPAAAFYDSIKLEDVKALSENDKARITARKPALKTIAENYEIINREDSLQKIAAMPDSLRNAYVKKISKALRKAQGLKGSDEDYGSGGGIVDTKKVDLFGGNDTKGEWYFSNSSLKSKGFNDFKMKWGKRQNIDNWRRQSAIDKISTNNKKPTSIGVVADVDDNVVDKKGAVDAKEKATSTDDKNKVQDISFEGLMSNVPLTKEALEISNKKVQDALFGNGDKFQTALEEYEFAIDNYDVLLKRYEDFKNKEQALFNLYYCYFKLGLTRQADSVMSVLKQAFPTGEKTKLLNTKKEDSPKEKNQVATKAYERIYNLFIEGKFEDAKREKQIADSTYGKSYWTPQLLYIEAIYYIKQREDSTAIEKLKSLIALVPNTPMAAKASNMIEVIKNRKSIESYLTNLQVERKEDEPEKNVDLVKPEVSKTDKDKKETDNKDKKTEVIKTIDKKVEVTTVANADKKAFVFNAADSQFVMVAFNKVDKVFFSEAKGAFAQYNREVFYNKKIDVNTSTLNDDNSLLLIGPFENAAKAVDYLEKARSVAASRIVSWIPADKYNFTIISRTNLTLLSENKELTKYVEMMKQTLPGKL